MIHLSYIHVVPGQAVMEVWLNVRAGVLGHVGEMSVFVSFDRPSHERWGSLGA